MYGIMDTVTATDALDELKTILAGNPAALAAAERYFAAHPDDTWRPRVARIDGIAFDVHQAQGYLHGEPDEIDELYGRVVSSPDWQRAANEYTQSALGGAGDTLDGVDEGDLWTWIQTWDDTDIIEDIARNTTGVYLLPLHVAGSGFTHAIGELGGDAVVASLAFAGIDDTQPEAVKLREAAEAGRDQEGWMMSVVVRACIADIGQVPLTSADAVILVKDPVIHLGNIDGVSVTVQLDGEAQSIIGTARYPHVAEQMLGRGFDFTAAESFGLDREIVAAPIR